MNRQKIKNFKEIAYSFNDDLNRDLQNLEFKKTFYSELLKLKLFI